MSASPDKLVVAVLGPGRLGETHVAALASPRDRGLDDDGRRVAVVPALYGRNAPRVRDLASVSIRFDNGARCRPIRWMTGRPSRSSGAK